MENERTMKDIKPISYESEDVSCKDGYATIKTSAFTEEELREIYSTTHAKQKAKTAYWCNECHCKVKTTENKCPKCNSQDLARIKKKPEIKFYFSKMEGWYLLPSIIVGRYRSPEDVGANTIGISFTFLCFDLQFEFWWNIADVKRLKSLSDVLEMALKLNSQEESK